MEEQLVPFDLQRMLVGDHPALFFLEIIFRTGLIYVYTLVLLRWIGGRSVAQLSMIDYLLVIALGSAVGDAPFYPDVPLLAALAVITTVIVINKLIDTLNERWPVVERVIDGDPVAVLQRGRLLPEGMARRDVSALEIKAMLRQRGISNMGQVESAYMEAGGGLSVFRRENPLPGLQIVPPPHIQPPQPVRDLGDTVDGRVCCATCGELRLAERVLPDRTCRNCGDARWAQAVVAADSEPGLLD